MPKILLTGSSGRIGQVTARELLEHGYTVTGADQGIAGPAHTFITDLCDLGQVMTVMAGHDAVIHLGAIPSPAIHPAEVVFRNNTLSTFNILEAATLLGIHKVVLASSVSALGYAWRHRHFNPHYLPIDEDHPLLSQDAYGLSKMVGEVLAEGFVRRTPQMSISSLRFTLVIGEESYGTLIPQLRKDPANSNSFWTYIDVRDAALSCRLALEDTRPGHDAFLISAPNSYMDEPTVDLFNRYYPGIEQIAADFGGSSGVFDCRHAAERLGFNARYNWDQTPLP